MRQVIIGVLSIFTLTACQLTEQPKTTKEINMYTPTGDTSGTAVLTEHPDGVEIKLKLKGLSPGFHGFHIHETSDCSGDQFENAGNHFNPDDKEHGLLFPKGPHKGDLKNVEADKSGKVNSTVIAEGTTLLKGKKNSLIDKDGTSLIVTSDPDDGMTQISGNTGERLVCGEIKNKGSDKKK